MAEISEALLVNPYPIAGEKVDRWSVVTMAMGIIALAPLTGVPVAQRDMPDLFSVNKTTVSRALQPLTEREWITRGERIARIDKHGRDSPTFIATEHFWSCRAMAVEALHSTLAEDIPLYRKACAAFGRDYRGGPDQTYETRATLRAVWSGLAAQLGNKYRNQNLFREDTWLSDTSAFDLLIRISIA